MTNFNAGRPTPPPLPPPPTPAVPVLPYMAVSPQVNIRTISLFRQQIHALGGLWILFGCMALGLGIWFLRTRALGNPDAVVVFVLVIIGALWLTAGVLACMKQMWAVYVGLGLSYLAGIANLARFNVCGLVITILVILQAHRVISWAGKMRTAGIPLNARR